MIVEIIFTEKWMNVNKSNVRIFRSSEGTWVSKLNSNKNSSQYRNLECLEMLNILRYGYASGGTAKAHSYYDESESG